MTSQDVDNYKQIKSDLDQLRSIVEKSELWVYKRQGDDDGGDGPSESDHKMKVLRQNFLTIIVHLKDFLWDASHEYEQALILTLSMCRGIQAALTKRRRKATAVTTTGL